MRKSSRTQIVLVGPFPPPVHGMAIVTSEVYNKFLEAGIETSMINLAASTLNRSLFSRIKRIPRVIVGLLRVLLARDLNGGLMYISVSAGLGQLYESLFLLLARFRHMKVVLHHHNSSYMFSFRIVTWFLTRIAGQRALHITQCNQMAHQLDSLYGTKLIYAITNAFFLTNKRNITARERVKVLGFLSNISSDKGIFIFLDLMEKIQNARLPIKALVAGPFQDEKTRLLVQSRLRDLTRVNYVGPKYGLDKEKFFTEIDMLIFPTLNEAEGIVNLEAMSRGLPIVAFGQGCIPNIVKDNGGLVISPGSDFASVAYKQIFSWFTSPILYQSASSMASRRFSDLHNEGRRNWGRLLAWLTVDDELISHA